MGVLSRKDAATGPEDWEALLAGVRRLTVLADGSGDQEAIFRVLAAELLSVAGAEEVHVHHLAPESEEEQVSVYMFEGNGRVSYMLPRGERPPGVSWVASSGRCLHLAEDAELARSAPRLTQAGDAVLREVVSALVGEFRAFDRVARYGGDEFVVIMPNADLRSAAAAAGRALERLRSLPGLGDEQGVPASIGVAEWHAPMSTEDLLRACDAALLRSKREGKGRVSRAASPLA